MSKKRDIPVFNHPIIETHCHLDYLEGDALAAVLQAAQRVNVERIITIGVSPDNLATVMTLVQQHPQVWGTQGIHPHDANDYSDLVDAQIRANALHDKIVAVGEIGLDYHYDYSDRAKQRDAFERQLQIAIELDLPIVVHTREADADTQAILGNFVGQMRKRGVIHSFTSSRELAEYCLGEGFCIGFNGISTFKAADNVREVIALTPLEQILLETDAPYLTPVPYRGHKNEPKYLPFIAEQVAQVKGISVETLLPQVWQNSLRVFWAGV
ncbi:MAG TPA: TatD family hydrolase [Candidatus Thiothrix moscowensis]|uniref:TatD family hydrolase n=1 Tax=unclassified Thiothrix TaxID=2636184 RepID=UPI0025D7D4CC|nr:MULTISPECIES: TatD family hydrolase [unclassified Thiothrix]HRJ53467.1 TatD family hydrolase [Candidatus Thiothrix moscowensis]HRJ93546.1 TatD family hydrolase [Candidatus Thiothrix moscowensis]